MRAEMDRRRVGELGHNSPERGLPSPEAEHESDRAPRIHFARMLGALRSRAPLHHRPGRPGRRRHREGGEETGECEGDQRRAPPPATRDTTCHGSQRVYPGHSGVVPTWG
jgi:hypothetical protein